MFDYLKRFFTYFKEECLCLKRTKVTHYPFDKSFKDLLPNALSASFAISLVRDLAAQYKIPLTSAEILIFLLCEEDAISAETIYFDIDHVSIHSIRRCLKEMLDLGYLYRIEDNSGDFKYGVMLEVRDDIRSYHKY